MLTSSHPTLDPSWAADELVDVKGLKKIYFDINHADCRTCHSFRFQHQCSSLVSPMDDVTVAQEVQWVIH